MPDPSFTMYVQTAGRAQAIGPCGNWKENRALVEATGLAPADDRESALPFSLPPGACTAVVAPSSVARTATSGVALLEFYRPQ